MTRTVLLQKHIDSRLQDLTGIVEEVNGILLYRNRSDYCPIETIFVTGVGDEGNVKSVPERMRIVNEFLRKNLDYNFVKFHTHSIGTIERFGKYYATNFSQLDIECIEDQIKQDRTHMALLITPETKILKGIDNPALEIVDSIPALQKRSDAIIESMKLIAKTLGYTIDGLKVTQQ
jgi:hypothetical protein